MLAAFVGLSVLIFAILGQRVRDRKMDSGWEMRAIYGFAAILTPVWLVLIGVVLFGLWRLVWSFPDVTEGEPAIRLFWGMIETEGSGGATDARWHVLAMLGLITALGGLVATPMTVMRLSLTQRQTDTEVESLFNDKINAARSDLHAMRQRTTCLANGSFGETIWEADVTRRNGAMYRLRELADQKPSEAARIVGELCVYVQELSREYPAKDPDNILEGEALRDWASELEPARPDLQTAVTVIGQLGNAHGEFPFGTINFSKSNLQGIDFSELPFSGARLSEARLDGSFLYGSNFQRADFGGCSFLGANLTSSRSEIANFSNTDLRGSDCLAARFQGSKFIDTVSDNETSVVGAKFRGSLFSKDAAERLGLSPIEMKGVLAVERRNLQDRKFFGKSKILPKKQMRQYANTLSTLQSLRMWRKWQKQIGFDPEDPATWDGPKP